MHGSSLGIFRKPDVGQPKGQRPIGSGGSNGRAWQWVCWHKGGCSNNSRAAMPLIPIEGMMCPAGGGSLLVVVSRWFSTMPSLPGLLRGGRCNTAMPFPTGKHVNYYIYLCSPCLLIGQLQGWHLFCFVIKLDDSSLFDWGWSRKQTTHLCYFIFNLYYLTFMLNPLLLLWCAICIIFASAFGFEFCMLLVSGLTFGVNRCEWPFF